MRSVRRTRRSKATIANDTCHTCGLVKVGPGWVSKMNKQLVAIPWPCLTSQCYALKSNIMEIEPVRASLVKVTMQLSDQNCWVVETP